MLKKRFKCLMVAVFSLFVLTNSLYAQDEIENTNNDEVLVEGGETKGHEEEGKVDVKDVIFSHVGNGHEFHFFGASIPLPVILYEPGEGFSMFMSSKFHHGETPYKGYQLVSKHYKERLKGEGMDEKQINLLTDEMIIAVDEVTGRPLDRVVYDFSLTRNVVQMFIALILLVWIMTSVAKRYRAGQGVNRAPKGMQNAIEPVITFVRDEVAKPNIGHKYKRFMPLLLTIFFFILINNIFGLLPGSANVTGNIAFTAVLGVITFLVVAFSGNKHYWGHIFNPPVPFGIKFIMVPVEILSIFTKPFALIVRLFANMLAGHIIIICLISLIFIFGSMSKFVGFGFTPLSIGFVVFIYIIEVLVAFIQAFIFTNLSAVFIGQAVEEGHDEHHEDNLAADRPVII